jgi:ribosomal protein L13E
MEQKDSKIFSKTIMQAVSAFCDANNIKDKDEFIYLCFKQGFDIKKFGLLGKTLNEGEKDLIKEVIVEKRVEIPVEVIKEVEKIVEVGRVVEVEKIVEVPVEVIKNVERIVEVPVEVERIVEVPVEVERIVQVPVETVVTKVEYISDKSGESELLLKIQQLESDKESITDKTIEMENNFRIEMSKKNEELDGLRRNLDELLDKPPVEIIREVEVIKEVEVTKEVEKIVEDPATINKLNMLQDTLQNLRTELQEKKQQINELEKINRDLLNGNTNQAYLLRGSNLNRRI